MIIIIAIIARKIRLRNVSKMDTDNLTTFTRKQTNGTENRKIIK